MAVKHIFSTAVKSVELLEGTNDVKCNCLSKIIRRRKMNL